MYVSLQPGTTVALLLCGRFGKPRQNGISPLEPREFNTLVAWLDRNHLPLEQLLSLAEIDLRELNVPVPAERLLLLLERGAALALAVESWESRGLWVMSQSDELYPSRFRTLSSQAPILLYGAGDPVLLTHITQALAIVGSRNVDEEALEYAADVARAAARTGIAIVSGGARGVDNTAVGAALDTGGVGIAVLADNLARAAVTPEHREALVEGQLLLISSVDPASPFSVGNAMSRNKYIYALADAGLVVSTAARSGGTWAGAVEALKRGSIPIFVRLHETAPPGNVILLEEGAQAFPDPPWDDLAGWLSRAGNTEDTSTATQGHLW